MERRHSPLRDPFRCIAIAATVWVIVGVPVAAVIAAFRVFLFVITALPEMAATAAVLGAVHGLWLYLGGGSSEPGYRGLRWFHAISGGALGLLGFPPVFSRTNIVADRLTVAIFLLAAVGGGVAAGMVLGRVATVQVRGRRSSLGRSVAAGCLLVLPLAALDYHFYWPAAADRLPVPRVSHEEATNSAAGNARGAGWTSCYQYLRELSRGSGVIGKEGGLLKVTQTDGALKVFNGSTFIGGVDDDGRFRFGSERVTGQDTLRVLWEGKFSDRSLEFTERTTVLRGTDIVNTTRVTGTAQRIPCNL